MNGFEMCNESIAAIQALSCQIKGLTIARESVGEKSILSI